MKGAENTTPQTPQYDYSNVPEGFTPSTGEIPDYQFDPSDTTGIEGVTLE